MRTVSRLVAAVVTAGATGAASALPVIQSEQFYTDRWGPSVSFPTLQGDYLHLFTAVNSADAPADVSAVATQGALVRQLNFFTGPIFAEKNFERYLTNTTLTGPWDLTVTDSSGSANGTFAAIADPEFLPLVLGLQAVGDGLTPTLTWTMPDLTEFDVDGIRARVVNAATSAQIFQSDLLPSSTTSFDVPAGLLVAGTTYEFRVILDDFAGQLLENRSNTFSPLYTATVAAVPEAETWAMMFGGLALVSAFVRRRRSL